LTTVTETIPQVPRDIRDSKVNLLSIKCQDLAEQFTLISFEILSKVEPIHLLYVKLNKKITSLMKLISHFNRIYYWVATQILIQKTDQERVEVGKYMIKLEQELAKQNNFNDLNAVVNGLEFSRICRSKETKKLIDDKLIESHIQLSKTLSPCSNYKNYRVALKKAGLPCIPYIGLEMTDLQFIRSGYPDEIEKNIANFQKCKGLYNRISPFIQYQSVPYKFEPIPVIQDFVLNANIMTDDELENLL